MKLISELDQLMCEPSESLIKDLATIEGDIMVLGAGGKMGPTLCKLAINAINKGNIKKKIYAVSRFSDPQHAKDLEDNGIIVIKADLLDDEQLYALPNIKNIIYMVGRKFGTSDDQSLTWAMNAYLPGRIADKFSKSKIVVFSTGNVYPFVPVSSGGSKETDPTGPVGIYAQSCLGRENVFKYFSNKNKNPMLLYRLNYAIDLRYGVLLEVGKAIYEKRPLPINSGFVNVIWQGEANEIAIRSLLHCKYPIETLNVTSTITYSLRDIAHKFAAHFNVEPEFIGSEKDTALLSNAKKCKEMFGLPVMHIDKMVELVANWIANEGATINKPTHFEEREGKF